MITKKNILFILALIIAFSLFLFHSESYSRVIVKSDKYYLKPNKEVKFNKEQAYIKIAEEITKEATNDEEKVTAIYEYIIENFKYDYLKIYRIKNSYLPNLDTLFDDKKGICYDYASIFAAMLRSVNIPTRLAKGYRKGDDTYHAWNEVKINDEWKTIDTTNSSYKFQNKMEHEMYKDASIYKVTSYN